MFDKLTIRTKLIAMVAAPLAVLIVLATFGSIQRRDEASSSRADAEQLQAVSAAAATAGALQNEALLSTALLTKGDGVTAKTLAAARAETDAAISDFKSTRASAGAADARDQIDFMADIRSQVDRGESGWQELQDQYFQVEAGVLKGSVTGLDAEIADPSLAVGLRSLATLSSYKSTVARLGSLLTGVISEGSFIPAGNPAGTSDQRTWIKFQKLADDLQIGLATFSASGTAEARAAVRNQVSGAGVNAFESKVEVLSSGTATDKATGNPADFRQATQSVMDKIGAIEATSFAGLLSGANAKADSASSSSRLYLGGALLAALLCLLLAIVVSSSITRPLAKLTDAVDNVAKEQLPRLVESLRNPVESDVAFLASNSPKLDIGGGAELSHLGSAVASIQKVAVEVATEQASLLRKGIGDMFINLARRNQTLLDRQIEFIDELEAEEQDPDHLEGLYKLDHMATRMRRNAESLLVLAGAEPTRRRGRPVPLADVVRAALGEVEDYGRIDLLGLDEVLVKSTAALDVAHLLSELMENATHFSPPDTRVEVVGHRTKSEGYVISITDHGIGMTPDQVTESNELLARPPLVGLAMSRSLGFIVIGRLAARFGINVRLMPSPTGGVTAVVAVPADVVNDLPPAVDEPIVPVEAVDPVPLASVTSISNPEDSLVPPLEYMTFDKTPAVYESGQADLTPVGAGSGGELGAESGGNYRPGGPAPRARSIDPATVAFGNGSRRTGAPEPAAPVPGAVEAAAPAARAPAVASTPGPGLFGSGLAVGPEPLVMRGSTPSALPEALPGSDPQAQESPKDGLFGTAPSPAARAGIFGHSPAELPEPLPSRSATPAAEATPGGPRLFGMPADPPGPGSPAAPSAASAPRLFGTPAPVVADASPTNGAAATAGEVTSAGLVRRKPRTDADGQVARRLPGADDGARNVTTTQRSPEEVRNMLSRFRSGQQQAATSDAKTPDDVSSPVTTP